MTNVPKIPMQSPTASRNPVAWVLGFALLIVGTMVYSLLTASRMAERSAPLIDATMEIKLEATKGHLWFEEAISGDGNAAIAGAWEHFDQSAWYARAMLEGGENPEGVFVPLHDPLLRREIEEVLASISDFRKIAEERWAAVEASGIGSVIDQRFDAKFEDLLTQADNVETVLQGAMARHLHRFRTMQGLLVVLCLGLSVFAGMVFRRYDRWQAHDTAALSEANAQLEEQTARANDMAARANDMAARAEMANKAKSEFLANMSHEIRTPMTAILGFAESIAENVVKPENVDAIAIVRRNGEYLVGIINDILDLSKIEAGRMTIERRVCQPCRIIADVASLMRVRASAKELSFNIEYIGAIPETIQSDRTRLRQILINLIGNAIKFTEVGAVRLVTRFVDDGNEPCLQFDVVDTGRGLTEEQAAKLFQPFLQADTSTTRKYGGTGLGLAISKRFAELLGGDVTVAASEMGVGSTFRATVATGPLDGVKMLDDPTSATVVAGTASAVARVSRFGLQGCRILVAEDGPDNQRLISFVLRKAGADVTVKENGKLALEAALAARDEGNPFDLILMDMQMPVMDGYEATGQLRQKGYTGPIIALTAHAMDGDRDKCIRAGCDDYATKPVNRTKLIDTIQQRLVSCEAASPAAT